VFGSDFGRPHSHASIHETQLGSRGLSKEGQTSGGGGGFYEGPFDASTDKQGAEPSTKKGRENAVIPRERI
jgi:hypothetical protein